MMPRTPLLLAAIVIGGCATSEDPYAFDPHPADISSVRPGADGEPVRTLVSIVGVHRPEDEDSHIKPALAIRLRVENNSSYQVTFDPASMVLFSGGLERFHDPIVETAGPLDLAPGSSTMVDACFPFPGDGTSEATDMSGLNLSWTLVIDGQPVTNSTSFMRRLPEYLLVPSRGVGVGYMRYPC